MKGSGWRGVGGGKWVGLIVGAGLVSCSGAGVKGNKVKGVSMLLMVDGTVGDGKRAIVWLTRVAVGATEVDCNVGDGC